MTRKEQEGIVNLVRLSTIKVRDRVTNRDIMTLCFYGVPRADEELTTATNIVYVVKRVRRHASTGSAGEVDATVWVDRVSDQGAWEEGLA